MDPQEFIAIRKRLGKTQKELCQLLGVSLQAIHSYEQGWRVVPVHAERQILFLLALRHGLRKGKPCWTPTWKKAAGTLWLHVCSPRRVPG